MPKTFTFILMLILIAGCTANPRVDFANAQDTFIVTVQTLQQNRDQFTEEEWRDDIVPLVNAGDAALDQYDTLTRQGLPPDSAAATLREVLKALQPFIE